MALITSAYIHYEFLCKVKSREGVFPDCAQLPVCLNFNLRKVLYLQSGLIHSFGGKVIVLRMLWLIKLNFLVLLGNIRCDFVDDDLGSKIEANLFFLMGKCFCVSDIVFS